MESTKMNQERLLGWKKLNDLHWKEKRREVMENLLREVAIKTSPTQLQDVPTPLWLCDQIIDKLNQNVELKDCDRIAVIFNLEFVQRLIELGINPSNIWFFADSHKKEKAAKEWYNVNVGSVTYDGSRQNGERIKLVPVPKKQFDCIVMNPPYQAQVQEKPGSQAKGSRNIIWDQFIRSAIQICDGGYIAAIHPPLWRKPYEHQNELFYLIRSYNLLYLKMNSKDDGLKTFEKGTPFDWYIMKVVRGNKKTTIVDINGDILDIHLQDLPFLPNCELDLTKRLTNKKEKCPVLYSYRAYETRQPWMSMDKSSRFRYPCIHTTPRNEVRLAYSSQKEVLIRKQGGGQIKHNFFGIPKVIFGDGGEIRNVVIDFEGKYGITQHAMGILIKSEEEGKKIKTALESDAFNVFLATACRWSQFMVDWCLFKHFNSDFWKEFI